MYVTATARRDELSICSIIGIPTLSSRFEFIRYRRFPAYRYRPNSKDATSERHNVLIRYVCMQEKKGSLL